VDIETIISPRAFTTGMLILGFALTASGVGLVILKSTVGKFKDQAGSISAPAIIIGGLFFIAVSVLVRSITPPARETDMKPPSVDVDSISHWIFLPGFTLPDTLDGFLEYDEEKELDTLPDIRVYAGNETEKAIRNLFVTGIAAKKKSDSTKSQQNFEQALSKSDQLPRPSLFKAQVFYELYEYDSVGNYIDRALTSEVTTKEDRFLAFWYRAFGLIAQGLNFEAIPWLDSAQSTSHREAAVWYVKASVFNSIERYDSAVVYYDMALVVDPEDEWAWHGKGLAEYLAGRKKAAVFSYNSALRIKPDFSKAWYNRAVALFTLEDWMEAEASCDSAVKYNPTFQKALDLLNRIQYRRARSSVEPASKDDKSGKSQM